MDAAHSKIPRRKLEIEVTSEVNLLVCERSIASCTPHDMCNTITSHNSRSIQTV